MTLFSTAHRRKNSAILLLECLVYIAVLSVVLGLAIMLFHRSFNHSRRLQKNLGQISSVLKAGEDWREDIRATTNAALLPANEPSARSWKIETTKGPIIYQLRSDDTLWRREENKDRELLMLRQVKELSWSQESRGPLLIHRWELELRSDREDRRFRPLFTFQAVGGVSTGFSRQP